MMLSLLLMMAAPQGSLQTDGDGVCAAGPAQVIEGERYRRHVPTRARRLAGARMVRVLMPGDVATADFREDRLTIRVDYRRRVTSVRCG